MCVSRTAQKRASDYLFLTITGTTEQIRIESQPNQALNIQRVKVLADEAARPLMAEANDDGQ